MAKTLWFFWLGFLGIVILLAGDMSPALAAPPSPAGRPELREVRRGDGALSACIIDQTYANGMHLNFARHVAGRVNIGIIVPRAGFKAGTPYPVMAQAADGTGFKADAMAQTPEMLLIDIPGKAAVVGAWLEKVVRGGRLLVIGRADQMSFPVTKDMLERLAACAAQPAAMLPPSVQALLQAAGLGDAVPFDPGMTKRQAFADYAWRLGGVTGGVRQGLLN